MSEESLSRVTKALFRRVRAARQILNDAIATPDQWPQHRLISALSTALSTGGLAISGEEDWMAPEAILSSIVDDLDTLQQTQAALRADIALLAAVLETRDGSTQ